MIGVALALVVVGLLLGFILPPFGFVPAAVGLVLLVVVLLGFGRGAARGEQ